MKTVAILLVGVTFSYAGWSHLPSVPTLVNTDDRAPNLPLGIRDIWWLKVRTALKPLLPPAVIANLDANVPDGFIVYPFQYPHYREPQLRSRVFAIPPVLEDKARTLAASAPANFVENSQIQLASPLRNQQPLEQLETYQISDPSLANYEQAGIAILDQNSLNVDDDFIQPLNLVYQDDTSSYNQQDRNNNMLARLKQARLNEVGRNLAEPVDGEQQAELGRKHRSHVTADKSDPFADYYMYSVVDV